MSILQLFSRLRLLGIPRRFIAILLGLDLSRTAVEFLAVIMLVPTIQYLQFGGDIALLKEKHQLWRTLGTAYGMVGLNVSLGWLLVTTYLFVLLRQALGYVYTIAAVRFRSGIAADLRVRMFGRFVAMSLDRQERLSSGGFGNGIIVEADAAANIVFQFIRLVGFTILIAIYAITLLFVSVPMTVLTITMGIAIAFALRGLLHKSHQAGIRLQDANEGLMRFISERLSFLRLIRMSGMEAAELKEFSRITTDQRRHHVEIERLAALLSLAVEPIFVGLAFTFLYVGSVQFELGLDTIALFMLVMLRLMPLGREIIIARQLILSVSPQLESLFRRLDDLAGAAEPAAGKRVLAPLADGIRFEQVSFSYPDGSAPALNGLSLEIPARQITALVGPSGGGKSTLVDLIPRLRVPQSGQILFDGVPIETFSLESLRSSIAFAPQVPQLFDITAGEHIRYGRQNASDNDMRAAADEAGALDFIEAFPEKFETRLGERGLLLSGGQRQRLDLARALVRKSPILILDEPTAALDAASEAAFRQVLQKLKARRRETILIIGHRLSTVAIADRLAVVESGRVAAIGTHDELMKRSDWYRQAWSDYMAGSPLARAAV